MELDIELKKKPNKYSKESSYYIQNEMICLEGYQDYKYNFKEKFIIQKNNKKNNRQRNHHSKRK